MNAENTWKTTFSNLARRHPAARHRRRSSQRIDALQRLHDQGRHGAPGADEPRLARRSLHPDLAFDSINSVKFIDPIKESIFVTAGFVGKLTQ